MSSLFGLIEMNKRSLFCSQFSLQTTNHNISNINNPGYSRQEVMYKSMIPSVTSAGVLGNGVSISNIRRANAEFYVTQMRRESAVKSGWESASSALSQMEIVFNEPSDTGMASALDEFFKSWNDLAADPTSVAARVSVKESAQMLCETFHSMDQSLRELEGNINSNIESNVVLFNKL